MQTVTEVNYVLFLGYTVATWVLSRYIVAVLFIQLTAMRHFNMKCYNKMTSTVTVGPFPLFIKILRLVYTTRVLILF